MQPEVLLSSRAAVSLRIFSEHERPPILRHQAADQSWARCRRIFPASMVIMTHRPKYGCRDGLVGFLDDGRIRWTPIAGRSHGEVRGAALSLTPRGAKIRPQSERETNANMQPHPLPRCFIFAAFSAKTIDGLFATHRHRAVVWPSASPRRRLLD
jgi:hypothetical protein